MRTFYPGDRVVPSVLSMYVADWPRDPEARRVIFTVQQYDVGVIVDYEGSGFYTVLLDRGERYKHVHESDIVLESALELG